MRSIASAALMGVAALSAGCSWTSNILKGEKIDYRTERQADVPSLEVPPDLTAPSRDGRFTVPGDDARKTTVSAAEMASRSGTTRSSTNVLPQVQNARVERAGNQRWIVTTAKPDQLWPVIKEFWQELGFFIAIERPESGVMETDWAENRAKIGQDGIRALLGRFLDNLYSTPERDKFRTRLEVGANGETEIYISHRGMIEIYKTEARNETVWQPRDVDPDLEADFLRRLMVRLGTDEGKAKQGLEAGARPPERAKIVSAEGQQVVELDESFDRAWRRVGLALDRVGFTVEDRDRAKGIYFVRYADTDNTRRKEDAGVMSRIAGWFRSDNAPSPAEQFQVRVTDAASVTRVAVVGKGTGAAQQTTQRILGLLHDQLK